ncbi:MAG: cyclic nucleotide-binding domain-containing protein, partial [Gammaproteobacteria bacterium]|nr:cyclic nucleotide-binding domain-containing protein [Gammaproteobacteria bacterium]
GKYIFRRGDEDNFNYYLLKGELEMTSDGRYVNRFVAGTDAARFALAQLRPRQLSAQAKSAVTMFHVDRELMDKFLTLEEREKETSVEMEVSEIDEGESGDWMTNMLQSELFARIPAVNIQRIFTLMEPVEVAAGEVVIRQGEPGDYYYVLEKGRCDVSVRPASGSHAVKVATLRDGDSFGEEALVSNAKRNATITMATDGQLMRLTKDNFIELIKKPALQSVTDKQGEKMVAEGAVWMDVRFPEEIRESGIAGSMNMPLNILRVRADTLDREKTYIACCDSGLRSSVAAFLLMQRGFTAHFLTGGLMRGPVEKKPEAAPPPAPEKQARKQKATAEPAEGKKAPQVESEKPERKPLREAEVEQGGEALAADVRLSSLKAELAKA